MKQVVICSVLKRNTSHMHPGYFMELAGVANDLLKDLSSDNTQIQYHTHKGFWRDSQRNPLPVAHWSRDRVHPNRPHGRAIYKASIRQAILKAVSNINRATSNR